MPPRVLRDPHPSVKPDATFTVISFTARHVATSTSSSTRIIYPFSREVGLAGSRQPDPHRRISSDPPNIPFGSCSTCLSTVVLMAYRFRIAMGLLMLTIAIAAVKCDINISSVHSQKSLIGQLNDLESSSGSRTKRLMYGPKPLPHWHDLLRFLVESGHHIYCLPQSLRRRDSFIGITKKVLHLNPLRGRRRSESASGRCK